jgi:hypothetical protein
VLKKDQAFITAAEANAKATSYLAALLDDRDRMIGPWLSASTGDPLRVRTVEHAPSFWLVPVVQRDRVLGHVEIGPDGVVWGHTYFYFRPDELNECPAVVTRISESEAVEHSKGIRASYPDANFGEPVFVHDGPRNRLAWMIGVSVGGELIIDRCPPKTE